jgi:putative ABC transport system permease protein
MIYHCWRMAIATLRRHGPTTLINLIGLMLGFTCFIMAHAAQTYFRSADRQFANFDRIYFVQQRVVAPGKDTAAPFMASASPALADYLRAEFPEIPAIARRAQARPMQVNVSDRSYSEDVTFADPEILRIFDLPFLAGDAERALEEPGAAVVSDSMAQTLFGTTDALGKVFTVNRRADAVVRGVVKRSDNVMVRSGKFDVLMNIAARDRVESTGGDAAAPQGSTWTNSGLDAPTYLLLPADGSLSVAEIDRRLDRIARGIVPPGGEKVSFRARHLSHYFNDLISGTFTSLGIAPGVSFTTLLFVPGIVLLAMACFNYTNLSVAIASTRAKQVGLRKVLGARSGQIVAQHLAEPLVTVLVAVAFALLLAGLFLKVIGNLTVFDITLLNIADFRTVLTLRWSCSPPALRPAVIRQSSCPVSAPSRPCGSDRSAAAQGGCGTSSSAYSSRSRAPCLRPCS